MNIRILIPLTSAILLLCGCGSNGDAQHKVASLDEFNKLIALDGVEYLQTESADDGTRYEYAPNIRKSYFYDGSQCVRVNNNGTTEEYLLDSVTGGVWAKSTTLIYGPWGDDSNDTVKSASPKYLLDIAGVDVSKITFNYDAKDYLYKGVASLTSSNAADGEELFIELGFINHKVSTFACYVTNSGERVYRLYEIYTYFTQIVPTVPDLD